MKILVVIFFFDTIVGYWQLQQTAMLTPSNGETLTNMTQLSYYINYNKTKTHNVGTNGLNSQSPERQKPEENRNGRCK